MMMRRAATVVLGLLTILILLSSPPKAAAQPEEGDFYVDIHWLDATQANDHTTVSVVETHFFNNTGSAEFSGDFYFWIPPGASVSASSLGGSPDFACRVREFGQMGCFPLTATVENIVRGTPFNGTVMAYYGQTGSAVVDADSDLGDADAVTFTVTVGGPGGSANKTAVAGEGLYLLSNATQLGAFAPAVSGMPETLSIIQEFTLFNKRSANATVNLTADIDQSRWEVAVLNESSAPITESLLLGPNETRPLYLRVRMPNYLVQVQVEYVLQMGSAGNQRWRFEKEYLYPTGEAQYYLFVMRGDNGTVGSQVGGFRLVHALWQEGMERWWIFYVGNNIAPGERATVTMYTEDALDPLVLVAAVLAIVGAAALIALAVTSRRKRRAPEEAVELVEEELPPSEAATSADVSRYEGALARIERDHDAGRLPDETYETLKGEYEEKLHAAREEAAAAAATAASTELVRLKAQKAQLLKAIKELRAEREAGEVDAETFEELEARYKKEAIAVMRRLDDLQEGDGGST